jgi:CRISP-associated protein Cas1
MEGFWILSFGFCHLDFVIYFTGGDQMPPVYVRQQGAVVRRRGERLVVTRDKEALLDLPLIHLDQLVIFGNVQLTAQAVAMLLQAEVDVVFLSQYGKFRGRLMHTGSKFAQLRHAQLSDDKVTLAIARQVVAGKLTNQRGVLKSATRSGARGSVGPDRSVAGIGRMLARARTVRSLESLRGVEGKAGADYWPAYRILLANDFGFRGRKYFPPPDPVNALLSFGYSLLLKDVIAAVQLVGLDPYLGFFHVIHYGRPSLALDMMEEFRPVLVDRLVLEMVNDGSITSASFDRSPNPKRPVSLTDSTTDLLIQRYEQRLGQRVAHSDAGGKTSLRRVIELQVRRLARVVLSQAKEYRPFLNDKV